MALVNLNTSDFLEEGTGVTLTQTDNVITVDATGGGGGHEIQEGGTPLATEPALNFDGDDFNLTDNPAVSTDVAINSAKWSTKAYAESLVVGLWDDRGNFDASVNAYPSSGGSGTAGAILKGDIWTISVIGTLPTGQLTSVGDTVRALVDTPGNTQANWAIAENNIGYVPENQANKDTDSTLAANSDTKYASQKAGKTYSDGKVSDTAYAGSWDGVTTIAPSKNSVYDQMELRAPLASPALTGTPLAPTPSIGDDSTKIATTEFVQDAVQAIRTKLAFTISSYLNTR